MRYRHAVAPPDRRLGIRLLGPLEVRVGGSAIEVDTRKALAIVALVAAEGRAFARDELAAMFWPEADDDSARGALRRTLSSLRTAAAGADGILIERTRVALDPGTASVDLADLERLAGSPRRADLEAAALLARGPFLAGFALRDSPAFDDWQAARASRVERTVGELFERLAAARLADGDASGAIEAARRRVDVDPLDEPGQRRLIELLARAGDRAGAIRQYRSLVALLDRELGVAPLHETTELYESIREDRPEPERETIGAPVPAPRPELPIAGRDRELADLLAAAAGARPDGRLLIVEGEAGIGKTRLAEAVAARVRARGGVVLASRGYPGEAAIAFGPIAELLRSGFATSGDADRTAALDPTALAEIGRLVVLPPSLRGAGRPAPASDPSARVRLLSAIADALTALASGPVPGLLWVDDLHHVDASTREAITFIARRLRGRPVALLVAWRREDLSAEALATAEELGRIPGALVVSLGRLDRTAIATLVRAARPARKGDATDEAADRHACHRFGGPATAPRGSPGQRRGRGRRRAARGPGPAPRADRVGRGDGRPGPRGGRGDRAVVRSGHAPARRRSVRGGDRRGPRGTHAAGDSARDRRPGGECHPLRLRALPAA